MSLANGASGYGVGPGVLVEVKRPRVGRLAGAALVAALALPGLVGGCAQKPQGLEIAPAMQRDTILGRWQTREGKSWQIRKRSDASYSVRSVLGEAPSEYTATIRQIGGVDFLEVSIYSPEDRAGVPVYLYGTLQTSGNTMTFRRVRAEWLESAARGDERVMFVTTGKVERGTGGLVVRSQRAMVEILTRATTEAGALGEPEVATRVE